jgi:hypothetical protein
MRPDGFDFAVVRNKVLETARKSGARKAMRLDVSELPATSTRCGRIKKNLAGRLFWCTLGAL